MSCDVNAAADTNCNTDIFQLLRNQGHARLCLPAPSTNATTLASIVPFDDNEWIPYDQNSSEQQELCSLDSNENKDRIKAIGHILMAQEILFMKNNKHNEAVSTIAPEEHSSHVKNQRHLIENDEPSSICEPTFWKHVSDDTQDSLLLEDVQYVSSTPQKEYTLHLISGPNHVDVFYNSDSKLSENRHVHEWISMDSIQQEQIKEIELNWIELNCLTYYSRNWILGDEGHFQGAMVYSFLLALLTQGLSVVRAAVLTNVKQRKKLQKFLLVAIYVHVVQQFLGFLIVLIAMMYSLELMFSVAVGVAIGNWMFAAPERASKPRVAANPAASSPQQQQSLVDPLLPLPQDLPNVI